MAKSQPSVPLLMSVFLLALFIATPDSAIAFQAEVAPQAATSDQQIVQRIDDAVRVRAENVGSYSVQELYSIFRNGEANPSAQVIVKTVYTRGIGKVYTPVSQTGSSILRNIIIDKILANEKEMAKAANRDSVSVTSANYEMTPEPGIVSMNGRDCIVIHLKAKRKTSFLFNGKAWFDSTDFTLVHIEGSPAESPSMFAGETSGKRDYSKVDGYSMALHAELHSHSFLFGDTLLKIDYSDYQIQLEPKSASSANGDKPNDLQSPR